MFPGDKITYNHFYNRLDNSIEFVTRRTQNLVKKSMISSPPFLPEFIAPLQRVKRIVKEDLGNVAGLLIPLDNGFEIRINATQPPERQNFSCAHEIGHTFFFEHEGISLLKRIITEKGEKAGNNYLEYLCDISAAELLMPSFIFAKYAAKYNFNIGSLSLLSNIFNTSIDATAIRLCDFINKRCYVTRLNLDKSQRLDDLNLRPMWLTWPRVRMPKTASRLLLNPKLLGQKSGMLKALRTDAPVYSREWMGIMNFRGFCRTWSKGFSSTSQRFVISFIFPECDN